MGLSPPKIQQEAASTVTSWKSKLRLAQDGAGDVQPGKLAVPCANEDPSAPISHQVPRGFQWSQPQLINLQQRRK